MFSCFCTLFLLISVTVRPGPKKIFNHNLSSGSKHVMCQMELDEWSTTLHTRFEPFVKLIAILVFDHMTTDHHRKLHDHALEHY